MSSYMQLLVPRTVARCSHVSDPEVELVENVGVILLLRLRETKLLKKPTSS